MNQFIRKQLYTKQHFMAITVFGLACTAAAIWPWLAWGLPVMGFLYTLYLKATDILGYMVFSLLITAVLSIISPFLGVIASLIFLFLRLKFFYENWHGLLSGVVAYACPFMINVWVGESFYAVSIEMYFALIFMSSALTLHVLLYLLYRLGYSHQRAITTMTLAPLIIILFLLPFLIKAISLFDDLLAVATDFDNDHFMDNVDLNESDHYTESYDYDDSSLDYDDMDFDDYETGSINPEQHTVRGHYRVLSSGKVVYVDAHIRTNPNLTITDNLSYRL